MITRNEKCINSLSTLSLGSMSVPQGYAIIDDASLWDDFHLLAETVHMDIRRVSTFDVWEYWQGTKPLFIEAEFARQLPSYWWEQARHQCNDIWVIFNDRHWNLYHTQLQPEIAEQYIILPDDISRFISRYGADQSVGEPLREKNISHDFSLRRSYALAVIGAHGGAGTTLFAFLIAAALHRIHRTHATLYVDMYGSVDASSVGVDIVPSIPELYRDPTSVRGQLLASFSPSHCGFYLAQGAHVFSTPAHMQRCIETFSQLHIHTVLDMGKFANSLECSWGIDSCYHHIVVSKGYPQSARAVAKIIARYPHIHFHLIVMGKYHNGLRQGLFEQLAHTSVQAHIPWDVSLQYSYQCHQLKIPAVIDKQIHNIIAHCLGEGV